LPPTWAFGRWTKSVSNDGALAQSICEEFPVPSLAGGQAWNGKEWGRLWLSGDGWWLFSVDDPIAPACSCPVRVAPYDGVIATSVASWDDEFGVAISSWNGLIYYRIGRNGRLLAKPATIGAEKAALDVVRSQRVDDRLYLAYAAFDYEDGVIDRDAGQITVINQEAEILAQVAAPNAGFAGLAVLSDVVIAEIIPGNPAFFRIRDRETLQPLSKADLPADTHFTKIAPRDGNVFYATWQRESFDTRLPRIAMFDSSGVQHGEIGLSGAPWLPLEVEGVSYYGGWPMAVAADATGLYLAWGTQEGMTIVSRVLYDLTVESNRLIAAYPRSDLPLHLAIGPSSPSLMLPMELWFNNLEYCYIKLMCLRTASLSLGEEPKVEWTAPRHLEECGIAVEAAAE
ncbi:MAG: hypothetical protein V2A73_11045, partial [Pseudomonadota bacterium]